MKKTIAVILTLSVMVGIIFQVALAREFSDMPSSHWAFQYVDKLSNEGVINGYEDGSFRPSKEVTRAEFFKLIACAMMTDEEAKGLESRFAIQPSENWYDKYVHYVKMRSMMAYSYSGDEYVQPITRQEMAFSLYKACVIRGMDINGLDADYFEYDEDKIYALAMERLGYVYVEASGDNPACFSRVKGEGSATTEEIEKAVEEVRAEVEKKKSTFSDTQELSIDSGRSIKVVSSLGLIKGYEDGTFRPYNALTRAEVATVIYRFSNLLNGGAV